MRRLLDINVLIALCDPNHVDHQRVAVWFEEIGGKAWVSCPITENGFVRILSNPNYPGLSGSVSVAAKLLQELQRQKGHEFWADDYSMVDGTIDLSRLAGHKQITDLYLLGLAVRPSICAYPQSWSKAGQKLTRLSKFFNAETCREPPPKFRR